MKVFLSWSPVPPDPRYWKWFSLDGIVVSIALLKQRRMLERATLVGLHDFLDFRGKIFLDSGSYEDFFAGKMLRPNSPIELLALAKWLDADFVAHLDIPFVDPQDLQSVPISGFTPIIFQIVPVTNLHLFLGEAEEKEKYKQLTRT